MKGPNETAPANAPARAITWVEYLILAIESQTEEPASGSPSAHRTGSILTNSFPNSTPPRARLH
jgi:hypothetical protein